MPDIPNTGNNGLVLTSVGNGSNASQWSKASNSSLVGIPSIEIANNATFVIPNVPDISPPLPDVTWQIGNISHGSDYGYSIDGYIQIKTPGVYTVNAYASFLYTGTPYTAFLLIESASGGSTSSTYLNGVPLLYDTHTSFVSYFPYDCIIYLKLAQNSGSSKSCDLLYLNATLISQE